MSDNIDFSVYPEDTLCRWVYELNHWRWPDDFPYSPPSDFAELPNRVGFSSDPVDKHFFVSEAMRSIGHVIPRDVSLQWYHINILEMPKAQSDEFIRLSNSGWPGDSFGDYYEKWNGRGGGDG